MINEIDSIRKVSKNSLNDENKQEKDTKKGKKGNKRKNSISSEDRDNVEDHENLAELDDIVNQKKKGGIIKGCNIRSAVNPMCISSKLTQSREKIYF